jgi:hypothetical protein
MATENFFDAEAFQQRIAQMTDSELTKQGKTAVEFAKMGFAGFPPEQVYVRQLEMCRAEWRKKASESLGTLVISWKLVF